MKFKSITAIVIFISLRRKEILLLTITVLVSAIIFDLICRVILIPSYTATKYGWTAPQNKIQHLEIQDTKDNLREITVQYFQNGFKRWGNKNANKIKVFVLGDSFTHMTWVSNGEEWYSYLEDEPNELELFVYGASGYGSLQEYMVLDDYIDEIDPDLILWQFCTNDYDNNKYELDALDYPFNNHAVRPYLEGNKIEYRLPLPFSMVRKYSFIGDRVLRLYDKRMWKMVIKDLDAYLHHRKELIKKLSHEERIRRKLLKESAFEVTLQIMTKVKERSDGRPIYLFNACSALSEKERKICAATGITCIPGIYEHIIERENKGYEVRVPNDGHWNKKGNKIAGEKLVKYFQQENIMKR